MVKDINVILFHATKKEKLGIIMKEGLRPGRGKCITTIGDPPFLVEEGLGYMDHVYFFTSFQIMQIFYELFKCVGIDTVLIVGMPADRVIVPNEDISIREYAKKYEYRQRFEDLTEVVVKGTVSPEYIIACLEIVEMEQTELYSWKYKPAKCTGLW